MVPGFLIKSLSDHYNSPGRLAEYKHQFQWAFRRPGDDQSIFAIELETLARRAFIDIDILIQLQMVRDRFIDGQVECALPETETLEDIIRRLLLTPALPPPQADPIPLDRDILTQQLMGTCGAGL